MTTPIEPIWITIREAYSISQYNPEYIRGLLRDGQVSGRKFGIMWQVDKASLLAYMKAHGKEQSP